MRLVFFKWSFWLSFWLACFGPDVLGRLPGRTGGLSESLQAAREAGSLLCLVAAFSFAKRSSGLLRCGLLVGFFVFVFVCNNRRGTSFPYKNATTGM